MNYLKLKYLKFIYLKGLVRHNSLENRPLTVTGNPLARKPRRFKRERNLINLQKAGNLILIAIFKI